PGVTRRRRHHVPLRRRRDGVVQARQGDLAVAVEVRRDVGRVGHRVVLVAVAVEPVELRGAVERLDAGDVVGGQGRLDAVVVVVHVGGGGGGLVARAQRGGGPGGGGGREVRAGGGVAV